VRTDGLFLELCALSFRTTLTLGEILSRLTAEGSRHWGKACSDRLGDYVASNLTDTVNFEETRYKNRLRLFFEEDRCILDILYKSRLPSAEEEWQTIWSFIHERLLPLVEAEDVQETHDYSS
jgi:hypothetical protein